MTINWPVLEIGSSGQFWRVERYHSKSWLVFYAIRMYVPTVALLLVGLVQPYLFLIGLALLVLATFLIWLADNRRFYVVVDTHQRRFSFHTHNWYFKSRVQHIAFDACNAFVSQRFIQTEPLPGQGWQALQLALKSGNCIQITEFESPKAAGNWREHIHASGEHPINNQLRTWLSEMTGIADGGWRAGFRK